MGVAMYYAEHQNILPAKGSWYDDIADYIGYDEKIICCPVTGDKFLYFGNGQNVKDIKELHNTVLFVDKSSHDGKFFVAFADGHIESLAGDTWENAVRNNGKLLP